jgi:hypothetical protein
MKKEVIFSIKADTAAFDRTVEAMHKKMKEIGGADLERQQIMTKTRLAAAGLGAPATPGEKAKADQEDRKARTELEKYIKEQVAQQDKLNKAYAVRKDQLEEMQEMQKKLSAGSKEELEVKEKILKLEESRNRLSDQILAKDKSINDAVDRRNEIKAREEGKKEEEEKRGIGLSGLIKGAIGPSALLAPIFAYKQFNAAAMENRIASAQGAAISGGVGGEQMQNLFGGQNLRNALFSQQAKTAIDAGTKEEDASRFTDALLAVATPLLIGVGVAGAIGAAPISGGLSLGLLGTGIGAAAGGGGRKLLSAFGGQFSEEYESQKAAERAQMEKQRFDAELAKNPLFRLSAERMMANRQQDISAQRALGLSDAGYFGPGGFLDSGEFERSTLMQNMSGILGAGGSTRAARNLTQFSARMGRDYDLTNAPQVLGRLSQNLGTQQTESATIKILSEAFKLGLNNSEFAEEQRKFVSMTAEAIARSGATTSEGAAAVASGMAAFVADTTPGGLQGAQTASQMYNQLTSQTSGPRGALQASAMLSDPNLQGLDTYSMNALMEMSPEQIMAGGNQITGAWLNQKKKKGFENLTLEDFKKSVLTAKNATVDLSGDADKIRKKILAKGGGSPIEDFLSSGNEEDAKDRATILNRLGVTITDFNKMPEQTKTSFMKRFLKGEGISSSAGELPAKGDVRVNDLAEQRAAEGDKLATASINEFLGQFKDKLQGAPEAIENFTNALLAANKKLIEAIGSKDRSAIDKAKDELSDVMSRGGLSSTPPKAGGAEAGND